MELEVGAATGATCGEKSSLRLAQRNGYSDRVWETRAGTANAPNSAQYTFLRKSISKKATVSNALPRISNISSISSSVMISGGQNSSWSPALRTEAHCAWLPQQDKHLDAHARKLGSNRSLVALFATSSDASIKPTPRASPPSGCSCNALSLPWNFGEMVCT